MWNDSSETNFLEFPNCLTSSCKDSCLDNHNHQSIKLVIGYFEPDKSESKNTSMTWQPNTWQHHCAHEKAFSLNLELSFIAGSATPTYLFLGNFNSRKPPQTERLIQSYSISLFTPPHSENPSTFLTDELRLAPWAVLSLVKSVKFQRQNLPSKLNSRGTVKGLSAQSSCL